MGIEEKNVRSTYLAVTFLFRFTECRRAPSVSLVCSYWSEILSEAVNTQCSTALCKTWALTVDILFSLVQVGFL